MAMSWKGNVAKVNSTRLAQPARTGKFGLHGWWLLALVTLLPACRTGPVLAPVDLSSPGWKVRQGQAVWHPPSGAPETAGEVVLGTRPPDQSLVQFSKNGFPLMAAQRQATTWQIELPAQAKFFSGHGAPPQRLLLLYLPRALAGEPLPRGWTWNQSPDGLWRLENGRRGEWLEGYFDL